MDKKTKKLNNNQKRWFYGLSLAVAAIILILIIPQPLFQLIVVILSFVGLHEFFNLTLDKKDPTIKTFGIILGGLATALFIFWAHDSDQNFLISTVLLIASFLIYFYSKLDFPTRIRNMAFFYLGVMYVSQLFAFLGLVRALPEWKFWVFLMLVCTFSADTGAYLFGRWLGKNKLAPLISPGKTVEGFLGGWLFSLLASLLVKLIFWSAYPVSHLVVIATLIAFVGPLGDLSESLLKRGANAKDSGNFIPGHGGILDRLDALLFAAPVVYYFAKYWN